MMYNDELKHRINQDSSKISPSPLKRMTESGGRATFIPPRIKIVSNKFQMTNQEQLLSSCQPKGMEDRKANEHYQNRQASARFINQATQNNQINRLRNLNQRNEVSTQEKPAIHQNISLQRIFSNAEHKNSKGGHLLERAFSQEYSHQKVHPKFQNILQAESIVSQNNPSQAKESIVIQKYHEKIQNTSISKEQSDHKMKAIYNFMKEQISICHQAFKKKSENMLKQHAQKIHELSQLLNKNNRELKMKQKIIEDLSLKLSQREKSMSLNKTHSNSETKITFHYKQPAQNIQKIPQKQYLMDRISELNVRLSILANDQQNSAQNIHQKLQNVEKRVIQFYAFRVCMLKQIFSELFSKYERSIPSLSIKIQEIDKTLLRKLDQLKSDFGHLKGQLAKFMQKQFKYQHGQIQIIHQKMLKIQQSLRNMQISHQKLSSTKKQTNFQKSANSQTFSLSKLQDYHFNESINRSNYIQDFEDQFFYPGQAQQNNILESKVKKFENGQYEQFISDGSDDQNHFPPHRSQYLVGSMDLTPQKSTQTKFTYNQIKVIQTISDLNLKHNYLKISYPIEVKYDKRGYIAITLEQPSNQTSEFRQIVLPLGIQERGNLQQRGVIRVVKCL